MGICKLKDNKYKFSYQYNGKRHFKTVSFVGNLNDPKLLKQFATFCEECQSDTLVNKSYTVSEYAQLWLDNYVRPSCTPLVAKKYKSYLNNRILPALGSYKITALSPMALNKFFNELKKSNTMYKGRTNTTLKKGSIEKIRKILSAMLEVAYQNGDIHDNPMHKVKIKYEVEEDNKLEFYDTKNYKYVLDCLKNESLEHRTIITLALQTGLRRSEMFGLKYSDIKDNLLTVERTRQNVDGTMTVLKPKTKSSYRTIMLTKETTSLLNEYKFKYPHNEFIFENLSIDGITQWFKKFQERIGIEPIKFHGLRHTHATILISNKVDPKTVQHRLGHSTLDMTLNVYTHALEEVEKEAVEKLEVI